MVCGLITLEVYFSFVILTAIACIAMPVMLKFTSTYVWREV